MAKMRLPGPQDLGANAPGLPDAKVFNLQLMRSGIPLRVSFKGNERPLYLVRTEITWLGSRSMTRSTMVRMLVGDGPKQGDDRWATLGDMKWCITQQYLVYGTPLMIFKGSAEDIKSLKLVRTTPNVESVDYDW